MSIGHPDQDDPSPEGEEETGREGTSGQEGTSGRKEGKSIHLRPADAKELRRVVSARGGFKSVPHLLREHLRRSLLPRIEEGRCFPGRLLAETAGKASPSSGQARTGIQPGLESWEPVEAAARTLTRALRRLEEERARSGGAGALPFCRCGRAEVVRAAAQEIATVGRGGPPELFSQEEACRWLGPGRETPRQEASGQEPSGQETPGKENPNRETSGREVPYQVLPILPGRERGGKGVHFYITESAKERLKSKGARLGQTGSDLARRATRMLTRWMEKAPAEALRYIREESDFYRKPRETDGSSFQAYVAPETKRRVEEATSHPGRGPGPGERPNQQAFLQAAARLAIEAPDEDMLPPLPGQAGRAGEGDWPEEGGWPKETG
ncbi:hypothetical protein [Salinibacter grassmerensis]|uniref:hypothetical protein n=1 Tax=Salinibacter grassmerensis TaxID=3040353 RepID=UPI0021E6E34A|nr:hypothetical protein [Salinibacter grassmerensis]